MKLAVYTVLVGGYDALLEQPVAASSDADFICFTDDPTLKSDTWRVELITPRFRGDLHRSSRVPKILGDERLAPYDVTVCVDASVRLLRPPEALVQSWLPDGVDMALATHSFREEVLDEFDEVIRLNYDDRARVHEQLIDYSVAYPDALIVKPHWGGIIVRRRSAAVDRAMRLWFDHVLRYSRRDQLSLMVALLESDISYRSVEVDNYRSEFHEWPVLTNRKVALGKAPEHPAGPLLAELRRARRRIDEIKSEMAAANVLRETVADLEARIAEGTEQRNSLAQIIDAERATSAELRRRVAWMESLGGAKKTLARAIGARFKGKAN